MRMEAVYLSKKEDRLNNIVKILEEHNGASVKELALMLDVSEMTIRRDLKYLEEKKIIETSMDLLFLILDRAILLNKQMTLFLHIT